MNGFQASLPRSGGWRPGRSVSCAALGFCWFFSVLVLSAWVSDDAYIAFRSMEQLLAGNGPNWNPHERAQVYSSVLWFWASYLVRLFVDDYFLLTLALSSACCAATLALMRRLLEDDLTWLVAVLLLTASAGLIHFGSSGLENPMSALIAVAYVLLWRAAVMEPTFASMARLFLLCAFVPLARHDMALLVAPGCAHAIWANRRAMPVGSWVALLLAAAAPVAAWTVFSLVYYGVPFPNTFYAKVAAGIPRHLLLAQGAKYYVAAILLDPVTVLVIVGGVLLMLRSWAAPLAYGLLLHLAYVLYIGGDFMLTRFLATDMLVAMVGGMLVLGRRPMPRCPGVRLPAALMAVGAALCAVAVYYYQTDDSASKYWVEKLAAPPAVLFFAAGWAALQSSQVKSLVPSASKPGWGGLTAAVALVAMQAAFPYSPARLGERLHAIFLGVVEERTVWVGQSSIGTWLAHKSGRTPLGGDDLSPLYHLRGGDGFEDFSVNTNRARTHAVVMSLYRGIPVGYKPVGMGTRSSAAGQVSSGYEMTSSIAVGHLGLAAGTDHHVIDRSGLTSPYLARTRYAGPFPTFANHHWVRGLPRLYTGAIADGPEGMAKQEPGTLLGDIHLVVGSADLFSAERLWAIYRLNTGHHGLLEPGDDALLADNELPHYLHGNGRWVGGSTVASRMEVVFAAGR